MDDLIDPHWDCYVCRRVTLPEQELAKRRQRPINEVWGTALGRKKHASTTAATNTITNGVTISPHKSDKERCVHRFIDCDAGLHFCISKYLDEIAKAVDIALEYCIFCLS
jgi:hypothetical protein